MKTKRDKQIALTLWMLIKTRKNTQEQGLIPLENNFIRRLLKSLSIVYNV